jgi:large repetitive protein
MAMMGIVKSIIGKRPPRRRTAPYANLQVGDQVFTDDVISTSATGSVQIALAGGQTLECGNDTSIAMSDYVIGSGVDVALQATPGNASRRNRCSPLQAAIAAGADPSQVAEATAAGGAPGAGGGPDGGGGRSIVVLEQGNSAQVVQAGFSTQGAGIDFPTPEFELLPEVETLPIVSVGVEVEVEIDPENPPPGGGGGIINVSGNTVDVLEGTNGGNTTPVTFNIVLSAASDGPVQVTYTIMAGSAAHPDDFQAVLTDSVIIPAGETSFPVTVFIEQDHLVEGTETFNIVLSDAVGAVINPDADTVYVNIIDDDHPPVANDDSNWVQEDGEKQVAEGNVLQSQAHPG